MIDPYGPGQERVHHFQNLLDRLLVHQVVISAEAAEGPEESRVGGSIRVPAEGTAAKGAGDMPEPRVDVEGGPKPEDVPLPFLREPLYQLGSLLEVGAEH